MIFIFNQKCVYIFNYLKVLIDSLYLVVSVWNIRSAALKFYLSYVCFFFTITLSVTKFKQLPRTHCKQLKNIQMLCHVLFFFQFISSSSPLLLYFISQLYFVVRQAFQTRKPEHTSRRNFADLLLRFFFFFCIYSKWWSWANGIPTHPHHGRPRRCWYAKHVPLYTQTRTRTYNYTYTLTHAYR